MADLAHWAPGEATALDQLSDVVTSGVTDGQALVWDQAQGRWLPKPVVSGSDPRVGEVINVRAAPYNAVGDGVTDDTTAIAAAITAASTGDTVLLPAGETFAVTSLTAKSNLTLRVEGTLKRKSGTAALITAAGALTRFAVLGGGVIDNNNSSSAVISLLANGHLDLWFQDCTYQGHLSVAPIQVGASGSSLNQRLWFKGNTFLSADTTLLNLNAITVINGADVWVRDNFFSGGGFRNDLSQSLGATIARGTYVIGNRFRDVMASCILVRPGGSTTIEEIFVADNHGHHIGFDPAYVITKGLAVLGENNTAGSAVTRRVTCVNNTLKWYGGNGMVVGGGGVPGVVEDVVVAGNVLDASDESNLIDDTWPGNNVGIQVIGCKGFAIEGNRVTRVGRGGIRVVGQTGVQVAQDGAVTGNTIDAAVQKTDNTSPTSDQECGIYVSEPAQDITIVGNTIKNSGRSAANTNTSGIGTTSTAGLIKGLLIVANRCFDDRGTKYQAYGVRLGYPSGTDNVHPYNCTIVHNDLRGNLTAGSLVTGPGTTDHGNALYGNRATDLDQNAALAHARYDRDLSLPAVLAPMLNFPVNQASTALTASRASFARFVPSRDMTAALIAFCVTAAAGADDACDVGIYDASGNRLVSAGATTGKLNATGIQTVTIASTTLKANTVYYAAFSVGTFGGTAASVEMCSSAGTSTFPSIVGSALPKLLWGFQNTAHPLPNPATIGAGIGTVPILAVRES